MRQRPLLFNTHVDNDFILAIICMMYTCSCYWEVEVVERCGLCCAPPPPPLPGDTLYTSVVSGMTSGAVASAIANPTDVLKVQLWGGSGEE